MMSEMDLLCFELDQDLSSFPNVPMIKRALSEGRYQLSSLRSEIFFISNPGILHTERKPFSTHVFCSTEEDDLVLRALARFLEKKFLLRSKELGYQRYSSYQELQKQFVEVGRVKNVVKIKVFDLVLDDFSYILRKVSSLVENPYILELISSFLSLPILKKDGTSSPSRRIPNIGMISTVLRNILLENFDHELRSIYPDLPYFDEAFVAFPFSRNSSIDLEEFVQEMKIFLFELGFDGKVYLLSAGKKPVPSSYGGFIFINENDLLTFTLNQ